MIIVVSDIPPSIQQYYRQRQMVFWNHDLPLSLNNSDMNYRATPPPWTLDTNNDRVPPQGTDTNPSPPRIVHQHVTVLPSSEVDPDTNPGEEDKEKTLNAIASSVTLSIVIFVGISFLLVNMCAFIGLYYQRDKLKVRERIVNSRYRCVNVGGGDDDDDVEERYMKNESAAAALESSRDLKNIEIKSILKSSDGIYEQVKAGSGKTASIGKSGKRMGIVRQASSSTVTIDPHTKVKEWIAHEIIQRCSPRFMRKVKKSDFKTGSCDIYADHTDQTSNKTVDSNVSKVGSLNTISKQKAKKVSVAVDATPATRSASVLQQTPIELTKSMDEGLVLSGLSQSPGVESMKASTSLMTILKRPSLQRSAAMNSDESLCDKSEPLRRSTSINLQLSTSESTPNISHFHSISEPVPSTSSVSKLFDIRLSPEKGPCDVLYSQVQKRPKLALPSEFNVTRDKTNVNVTSRDDISADTSVSAEEALDNIKRKNYPKVLPDYPDVDDFHLQKAIKRRSLPLCAQIPTDPGGGDESPGDVSMTLKVPPPPPPRVSTLGRKPSNSLPVSPLTSQLTVKLKPTSKSQVPLSIRNPQMPQLSSPIRPAANPSNQPSSQSHIKRLEPRVIIKPTMNPITSKKDSKQTSTSNIPRVTPPQPSTFEGPKDTTPRPPPTTGSRLPDMGMGRKAKITPIKKTVSTETALDASVSNAESVKRLNK